MYFAHEYRCCENLCNYIIPCSPCLQIMHADDKYVWPFCKIGIGPNCLKVRVRDFSSFGFVAFTHLHCSKVPNGPLSLLAIYSVLHII